MNTSTPYRLKLPLLQWLFLAFLSAGISSGIVQHQSIRPVSGIENVFQRHSNLGIKQNTVCYKDFLRVHYHHNNLNKQTAILVVLSKLLSTYCKISLRIQAIVVLKPKLHTVYFAFLRVFPEETPHLS